MSSSTTSDVSELSQFSSHRNFENDLPSNTNSWSIDLIDKFGIRKVPSSLFELIRTNGRYEILPTMKYLELMKLLKYVVYHVWISIH